MLTLNPLLQAAKPFYHQLLQLSSASPSKRTAKQQQQKLNDQLKQFTEQARANGYPDNTVKLAYSLLAAWADECLSSYYSDWDQYSLLTNKKDRSRFTAPRFFGFIKRQLHADNLPWLELVYLSLRLGFTAGEAPQNHRENQHEITTDLLYHYIQKQQHQQLGSLPPQVDCLYYNATPPDLPLYVDDDVGNAQRFRHHCSRLGAGIILTIALGIVIVAHEWANQRLVTATYPINHALQAIE